MPTMQPYAPAAIRVSKCQACEGMGWQMDKRSTKLYACGYIDVAVKCSACGGTGRAPEAFDRKMAAAGD